MKINIIFLSLAVAALALPTTQESSNHDFSKRGGCVTKIGDKGTVVKRCPIPWTKNYGDYDALEKRGGCVNTIGDDGRVVKRCPIPWTKNYGNYDS